MASSLAAKSKTDVEVCESALKFVNLYNKTADVLRSRLNLLYANNDPCLIYNGTMMKGITEITNFWNALQKTQHEVSCIDAHALGPESAKSMVAQVMGNVSLDGQWHAYTQVLVLVFEEGNYRIQSDTYRIIE